MFILLPIIFVALVHLYLWRRLIHDTKMLPGVSRGATLALSLLGASIPATFVLWWGVRHHAPPKVAVIAFGWIGLVFYLVALLVSWDVVRVLLGFARRVRSRATTTPSLPPPMAAAPQLMASVPVSDVNTDTSAPVLDEPSALETRRVFVARVAAGSALVAAGGIGVFGVRSALWDITMPEVPVRLARLPKALDGYTIALLTDVHIGPLLDGRFLRHLVEQTNRARPDLVAIGGDLVDGHVPQIGAAVAELRGFRARDGVCFVTGNHEYYSGATAWVEFLRTLGVRVLMNERVALGDAAVSGAQFDLAGVPDHHAGRIFGAIAPDAREATQGRDDSRELVMLAHQPVQIAESAAVGVGLQLSGHTHGGQLYPFGAVALLGQPYLAGLHLHEASGTQVYVSRGTGFWGPPMRVLAPAEITLIRLHSA